MDFDLLHFKKSNSYRFFYKVFGYNQFKYFVLQVGVLELTSDVFTRLVIHPNNK